MSGEALQQSEILDNFEFISLLSDWQQEVARYDSNDSDLYQSLVDRYGDMGGVDRAEETVSYLHGLSLDAYIAEHRDNDGVIDRQFELRAMAESEREAAKAQVIAHAERQGADVFTLYGLQHSLRQQKNTDLSEVVNEVRQARDNLRAVDEFVREHGGEVVTVYDQLQTVQAGQLTGEGITIVDRNVVLPINPVTARLVGPSYHPQELQVTDEEVQEVDQITVNAAALVRRGAVIVSPEAVLDAEKWLSTGNIVGNVVLTAGEVPAGPLKIPHDKESYLDHYTRRLNAFRHVGRLAAESIRPPRLSNVEVINQLAELVGEIPYNEGLAEYGIRFTAKPLQDIGGRAWRLEIDTGSQRSSRLIVERDDVHSPGCGSRGERTASTTRLIADLRSGTVQTLTQSTHIGRDVMFPRPSVDSPYELLSRFAKSSTFLLFRTPEEMLDLLEYQLVSEPEDSSGFGNRRSKVVALEDVALEDKVDNLSLGVARLMLRHHD